MPTPDQIRALQTRLLAIDEANKGSGLDLFQGTATGRADLATRDGMAQLYNALHIEPPLNARNGLDYDAALADKRITGLLDKLAAKDKDSVASVVLEGHWVANLQRGLKNENILKPAPGAGVNDLEVVDNFYGKNLRDTVTKLYKGEPQPIETVHRHFTTVVGGSPLNVLHPNTVIQHLEPIPPVAPPAVNTPREVTTIPAPKPEPVPPSVQPGSDPSKKAAPVTGQSAVVPVVEPVVPATGADKPNPAVQQVTEKPPAPSVNQPAPAPIVSSTKPAEIPVVQAKEPTKTVLTTATGQPLEPIPHRELTPKVDGHLDADVSGKIPKEPAPKKRGVADWLKRAGRNIEDAVNQGANGVEAGVKRAEHAVGNLGKKKHNGVDHGTNYVMQSSQNPAAPETPSMDHVAFNPLLPGGVPTQYPDLVQKGGQPSNTPVSAVAPVPPPSAPQPEPDHKRTKVGKLVQQIGADLNDLIHHPADPDRLKPIKNGMLDADGHQLRMGTGSPIREHKTQLGKTIALMEGAVLQSVANKYEKLHIDINHDGQVGAKPSREEWQRTSKILIADIRKGREAQDEKDGMRDAQGELVREPTTGRAIHEHETLSGKKAAKGAGKILKAMGNFYEFLGIDVNHDGKKGMEGVDANNAQWKHTQEVLDEDIRKAKEAKRGGSQASARDNNQAANISPEVLGAVTQQIAGTVKVENKPFDPNDAHRVAKAPTDKTISVS